MKVYIVLFYVDYEGYGDPMFVTSDKNKAEQFVMDNLTEDEKQKYKTYEDYLNLYAKVWRIRRDAFDIFEEEVVE